MKDHKEKIQSISMEFFKKCNELLKHYQLNENVEIDNIRFKYKETKTTKKVVCRLVKDPRTGVVRLVCKSE